MRQAWPTIGRALALALTATVIAACYWGEPRPGPNRPPVINGFIVDGETVDVISLRDGDQTTVTLIAWDPNGDPIAADSITWAASAGTVEGGGSSVRFKAPDVVWETPPQDVTLTLDATIDDGTGSPVSQSLAIVILPPCPADNQKPVIRSLAASPESIRLGERATITADAEDPEGADLTYTWTPPFGWIEGEGAEVVWVTDEVCCTDWYDIEVVVSDGCASSWDFVSVYVTT